MHRNIWIYVILTVLFTKFQVWVLYSSLTRWCFGIAIDTNTMPLCIIIMLLYSVPSTIVLLIWFATCLLFREHTIINIVLYKFFCT